ncbi:MAG: hypothetical protein PQ975_02185 [Methanobacterium sp.]
MNYIAFDSFASNLVEGRMVPELSSSIPDNPPEPMNPPVNPINRSSKSLRTCLLGDPYAAYSR